MVMEEQTSPRYSTISRAPPRYSTVFDDHPSTRTHYQFPLKNGQGKTWASVNLRKENISSASSSSMPVIVEGARRIAGSVTLDLESPETILNLVLSVRGSAITGANEGGTHTFLDQSLSLWSKDHGDPHEFRTILSSEPTTAITAPRSGKLLGTYSFPFNITLPSGDSGVGALPESFHERLSGVRVKYELVLKVGRGKFRADSKLQIPIMYRRKTAPAAASELRQQAYLGNITAPGPDVDPYGWIALSPVDCTGRLLNSRTIVLRSILYLASPLSYTRGSFIPCYIRIESLDEQALDLLASPRTIILRLCRRIKYLHDAGQGMQKNKTSIASRPKYEVEDAGQAVWQHYSNPNEDDTRVRCLTGEIHLPKNLPPSSNVVPFGVEYIVAFSPFESATFLPNETTMLQTQAVEIATDFAQGPVPSTRASISRGEDASTTNDSRTIAAQHENPFQLL